MSFSFAFSKLGTLNLCVSEKSDFRLVICDETFILIRTWVDAHFIDTDCFYWF
jgi:hypothetical protein